MYADEDELQQANAERAVIRRFITGGGNWDVWRVFRIRFLLRSTGFNEKPPCPVRFQPCSGCESGKNRPAEFMCIIKRFIAD